MLSIVRSVENRKPNNIGKSETSKIGLCLRMKLRMKYGSGYTPAAHAFPLYRAHTQRPALGLNRYARGCIPCCPPNATLPKCGWEDTVVVATVPNSIPHLEFLRALYARNFPPRMTHRPRNESAAHALNVFSTGRTLRSGYSAEILFASSPASGDTRISLRSCDRANASRTGL